MDVVGTERNVQDPRPVTRQCSYQVALYATHRHWQLTTQLETTHTDQTSAYVVCYPTAYLSQKFHEQQFATINRGARYGSRSESVPTCNQLFLVSRSRQTFHEHSSTTF